MDPAGRRVTIEGGATLADLDAATQAHGLATPVGINSTTGIAGLTLGGGFGWLSRKYGMTVDNLESAEVVTAAGEVVRASAAEHPDLFWALRGGGGNFGVVTRFEFRLHPVGPDVLSGLIVYPISEAKSVLQQYREFHRQGAGRAHRVDRPAPGAAPAVPPRAGPRQGDCRTRADLCGGPETGGAAHRAVTHVRHPPGRTRRRPAVRRLAAGLRPAAHPRRPQLLEVPQFLDAPGRAVRRRHRRPSGRCRHLSARSSSAPSAAPPHGRPETPRRTRTATPSSS